MSIRWGEAPTKPACLKKLGSRAFTEGDYQTKESGRWTEMALYAMDDAFCDAMTEAHPELTITY